MTVERDLGKLVAKVDELERRGESWDEAIKGLTQDRWWLRGFLFAGGALLGVFGKTLLSHLAAG